MSLIDELMGREIPSEDVTQLRALMRLPDDYGNGDASDLPYDLKYAYWEWKVGHDRIDGSGLTTMDFKCIGMFAGVFRQKLEGDDAAKTFLELVDAGEVSLGAPVNYVWRRKSVPGFFIGLAKDRKHARIDDGSGNERQVITTDVVLDPTRDPRDLTPAAAKKADKPAKQESTASEAPTRRGPGRPPKQEKAPVAATSSARPDIHAGQDLGGDDDI